LHSPDQPASLPTGTVTFLFTDIEGSTRMLDELGEGYAEVLAEHHRVLRRAIEEHGGVEVDTQGDAFFVSFARASDAVAAASSAQEALADSGLRVRMGIHTGEPLLADTGYIGMDVHRAARVMSAGHGGQVVLSQTTRDLLDEAFELQDLGEHRLKDLSAPQRLFQLGSGEFPALKTLHQTNLPVQPTPLVGRDSELVEAGALLRGNRLVTLVGPGGSGKTRLALQLAAEAIEDFEGGVFWVPLQAVADPRLVESTIAQSVGASDGVAEFLRGRTALLLLDNLEQVLEAAPDLAELLRETSGVKLLATSREPLNLAGEQRFPVDPLPDDDAIILFLDRARAVDPGFSASPAVGEICRRLDGLPLALELAAARVSVLSAEDLATRLERALPLLTGGARDVPERQRTLRAAIEWSYELLDEEERRVFRALSIFAGSLALDSALTVCDADLDELQSLIDKSLVRRWASGRFGMLETIHEYARGRLDEAGEAAETGRRHAEHFLAVARSTNLGTESDGPGNHELARLEQANFRAALRWTIDNDETELGLALVVALSRFWVSEAPFEGARWYEALLADTDDMDPALCAAALRDYGGTVYIVGEFDRGVALYEASLALYRELGDEWGVSHMLHRFAAEATRVGDFDQARALTEEALSTAHRLGDRRNESIALATLADVAQHEGDIDRAIELYAASAELAGEAGFAWWQGGRLLDLGEIGVESGRREQAEGWIRNGLAVLLPLRDRQLLVYGLAMLAALEAERGHTERAGQFWGAVEAEEQRGAIGQWESAREEYERRVLAHADSNLQTGREAGRLLSLEDAVSLALSRK
jgi:predicted ATPase/class 3 adenylate cyclase